MEQAAALAGLESAVWAALRKVTQPEQLAEEPFVAQPGQTVSHLQESLLLRQATWGSAQQLRERLAT